MRFQLCLTRNADLATNQPIQFGVQNSWPRLHAIGHIQLDRKQNFAFVAEVHQWSQWQAFGRGKLQRSSRDAVWKRPANMRRLTGIAGVLPIDMPAWLELEIEPGIIVRARIERTPWKYKLHVQLW